MAVPRTASELAVMTDERAATVRRICEAALDGPPSEQHRYIVDACGGDDALQAEVEALLAGDASATTFLSSPALELEARQIAGRHAALERRLLGATLSHYRIVDRIGEGGMGIVYKAIDTRLERQVAVKLIIAGDAADADRRRRFVREARAASVLNHPNIVSI